MCQHLSETIKIVRATYLLLILKISETKTASLYKEKEDDREREREREREEHCWPVIMPTGSLSLVV